MMFNFDHDLAWSAYGERAATVATLKHKEGIVRIKRPQIGVANSSDIITSDDLGAQARIDYKIDDNAWRTHNCCVEMISQFKEQHASHWKAKPFIYNMCMKILAGYPLAWAETLYVLNLIKEQLVEGKPLKYFTENQQGWAMKHTESSRSIGVFCFDGVRNTFENPKNQKIIREFFKQNHCLNQDIGKEQICAIKEGHDKLFNDLKVNEYRLYFINKAKLKEFIFDAQINSAVNADNGSYQTLNYLVPFEDFETQDWCTKFVWHN